MMHSANRPLTARGAVRACFLLLLVLAAFTASTSVRALAGPAAVRLPGHLLRSTAIARVVGRVAPQETIQLTVGLPLRNEAALNDLLQRLYTPSDPLYGQYLEADEFTSRFAPTPSAYAAVASFAQAQGLTVTGTHPNRLLLDVSGPAAAVEQAFQVHLLQYQSPNGDTFSAPDAEPAVPGVLAGAVSSVTGLDSRFRMHPHLARPNAVSHLSGSGPQGGFAPSDIKKAYNLSNTSLNGTGQTLALYELDGYTASDITAYETQFGLPNVTLQNILVDGFNGAAGSGADEVTLDIELQIALAPSISKILVYEGPNPAGVLDTYNKIATDNLAKQISTSWGLDEPSTGAAQAGQMDSIFKEMATQGQSIYAAAGDNGAYDDGATITVDVPASDPMMTGVGGTALITSGAGGPWLSETTWNTSRNPPVGGGGGISTLWSIPSYQKGVVSAATLGSTTQRNVPDVSLDADPNTGYSIFVGGSWTIIGGTSAAAPLWAAFTALVNQGRVAQGAAVLGFANPSLYSIGSGGLGPTAYHDIADNSTNLKYPAVTGYDDATGWGSFNGANLITALLPPAASAIQFDQASYAVVDGDTVDVTISRGTATTDGFVTVKSTDGTAVSPANYGAVSTTVEFPIGILTQTVMVKTKPDLFLRAPLGLTLALSNPVGVTLGNQITTAISIGMDRSTRTPTDVSAALLDHGLDVTWTDNAANTVSFKVERTTDGTNWVTIAPGVTGTELIESNPPVGVSLSYRVTAQNGQFTSLASDPSDPIIVPFPAVNFGTDSYTVVEGGTASIVVHRLSPAGTAFVSLTTVDDTAVSPENYSAVQRVITFAPGVTSITVPIVTKATQSLQDPLTVDLSLSDPSNLTLGDTSDAILTITFDPSRPAPSNATAFVSSPSSITVQWTSNSVDEDEFKIERSDNSGPWQEIGEANAGDTEFVDDSIVPGATVYSYRVRASRSGDNGDIDSSPSNKTTGLTVPVGGRLKVSTRQLSFSGKLGVPVRTKKLTLTNTGKGSLTGYVAQLANSPFHIVSGSGSFVLAPQKSWTVVVQFSSAAVGSFSDTINITGSGGDASVKLQGKIK